MIRIWFNSNGLYVLSKEVAESFDISHDDLIKKIMHIKTEFNLPKEWIDEVADENGYFISRNAFVLLVSKLNNSKLVIEYLNAFDQKEKMLNATEKDKPHKKYKLLPLFQILFDLVIGVLILKMVFLN